MSTQRRFPPRFKLSTLLFFVTLFALASICIGMIVKQPREYPRVEVAKRFSGHQRVATQKLLSLTVRFNSVDDRDRVMYNSYGNFEILHMVDPLDGRSPYYYRPYLAKSMPFEVGTMRPVYQKRYEALRAFIDQQVDIDKKPWPWHQTFILPADYPTFTQFEKEFLKKQKQP